MAACLLALLLQLLTRQSADSPPSALSGYPLVPLSVCPSVPLPVALSVCPAMQIRTYKDSLAAVSNDLRRAKDKFSRSALMTGGTAAGAARPLDFDKSA